MILGDSFPENVAQSHTAPAGFPSSLRLLMSMLLCVLIAAIVLSFNCKIFGRLDLEQ